MCIKTGFWYERFIDFILINIFEIVDILPQRDETEIGEKVNRMILFFFDQINIQELIKLGY